jgi:uncharacterized repeat protein (TIGR01451 family)
VIEYTATYRNTGTAVVGNLEATLPIPADTEFIAGSTKPAGARVARFARLQRNAARAQVTREGRSVDEPVPTREYRALAGIRARLTANQAITFTARVRVLPERAANGPPEAKGTSR